MQCWKMHNLSSFWHFDWFKMTIDQTCLVYLLSAYAYVNWFRHIAFMFNRSATKTSILLKFNFWTLKKKLRADKIHILFALLLNTRTRTSLEHSDSFLWAMPLLFQSALNCLGCHYLAENKMLKVLLW